jgi:hypothetical protein
MLADQLPVVVRVRHDRVTIDAVDGVDQVSQVLFDTALLAQGGTRPSPGVARRSASRPAGEFRPCIRASSKAVVMSRLLSITRPSPLCEPGHPVRMRHNRSNICTIILSPSCLPRSNVIGGPSSTARHPGHFALIENLRISLPCAAL